MAINYTIIFETEEHDPQMKFYELLSRAAMWRVLCNEAAKAGELKYIIIKGDGIPRIDLNYTKPVDKNDWPHPIPEDKITPLKKGEQWDDTF